MRKAETEVNTLKRLRNNRPQAVHFSTESGISGRVELIRRGRCRVEVGEMVSRMKVTSSGPYVEAGLARLTHHRVLLSLLSQ